jgi:hypothetical protein
VCSGELAPVMDWTCEVRPSGGGPPTCTPESLRFGCRRCAALAGAILPGRYSVQEAGALAEAFCAANCAAQAAGGTSTPLFFFFFLNFC